MYSAAKNPYSDPRCRLRLRAEFSFHPIPPRIPTRYSMRIAVPRESADGETRVAATPDTIQKFVQTGNEVAVQTGAGVAAGHPDSQFTEAGASITPDYAA